MTPGSHKLRAALRALVPVALAVVLASCAATTLSRTTTLAERMSVARSLSAKGDCAAAIEIYKAYIATGAGSADVDEAIYLLGVCYMKIKDPASAAIEFERLIRDYPESDSAAAASYQLGNALYAQTRPIDFDQEFTARAIRQWQGYLRAFPGDAYNAQAEINVGEARNRLAQKALDTASLYVKLRLWEPARVYFRKVVNEYPESSQVAEAMVGLAQCDVEEGKGTSARARLEDVQSRFPGTPAAMSAARMLREIPQ